MEIFQSFHLKTELNFKYTKQEKHEAKKLSKCGNKKV